MGSDPGATLDEISRVTLAHYEECAEPFWLGTRDYDPNRSPGIEDFVKRSGQ